MENDIFVKLDADGKVTAISSEPQTGYVSAPSHSPEVAEFLANYNADQADSLLLKTDAELARVLEDVIDLLTQKGVFQFTELPEAAQNKLLNRQRIRRSKHSLNLFDDEDIFLG